MAGSPKRSRSERRSYTANRAERTEATAVQRGQRWSVRDARIALDLSLSVPEAALQIGRTATAVENLRRRWRRGELAFGLADQVPPPPRSPESGKDAHR